MIVTIADYAGFCFGVERAINIVYDSVEKYDKVVTFGPIIHNPQVVESLQSVGVDAVQKVDDVDNGMTVVIRTHGVTTSTAKALNNKARVLDATCPFVKKVQDSAKYLSDNSYYTVIVGEKEHPEVQSIISYVDGEYSVINTLEMAMNLEFKDRIGVVAQTTQNEGEYNAIVEQLTSRCNEIKVMNTICSATHNRQKSSLDLAKKVDAMIIIGGKNSANTSRLYQLCKVICNRTYHIETVDELTDDMMDGVSHMGITSGASTPSKLVHQVKEYILERANE